jgi:hypothetical protein
MVNETMESSSDTSDGHYETNKTDTSFDERIKFLKQRVYSELNDMQHNLDVLRESRYEI